MRFLFLLTILSGICCFSVRAQEADMRCGTDEVMEQLILENPEMAEQMRKADSTLAHHTELQKKSTQSVVHRIPVVVHVIYNSEYDNISKQQIEDALRILNEDFRRNNPDASNTRQIFQSVAADAEIEFMLAKQDPNGNCTDGITRTMSASSIGANDSVKPLVHWDNTRYLNIWVVNSINLRSAGTTLGYAYLPAHGQGYSKDGIVIRHDQMGSIGTSVSAGRTLTHEVGHYLGLRHTFQNGCAGGDNIGDTPPVASASSGCNLSKNSCNNDSPDRPDMVENYMDYSNDDCVNLFTIGQKNAMKASLQVFSHRNSLTLPSTHASTGLTSPPPCTPAAKVASSDLAICPGDTVSFADISEEGIPTSWTWYFEGGQPSVSNDSAPVVSYGGAGSYDVTLVVSNSAGSDSIVLEDYVNVREYYSGHEAEWVEDFESPLPFPEVSIHSPEDNIQFTTSTIAASSGTQSLFLDNFNAQARGAIDEFISPMIFTAFGEDLTLHFDYAFARRASGNSDVLQVMVSTDCGKTWSVARRLPTTFLRTTPHFVPNPFVPTPSQWRSGQVTLNAYEDQGPILIKFQYTSGGGNNLYIDNINFTASNVSLEETDLAERLDIFPNPAGEEMNIRLEGGATTDMTVSLTDIYGKNLRTMKLKSGENQLTIQRGALAAGVYMIRVSDGNHTYSKKLVIK